MPSLPTVGVLLSALEVSPAVPFLDNVALLQQLAEAAATSTLLAEEAATPLLLVKEAATPLLHAGEADG